MRTFPTLPPPTEGYAGFFAAMQLAKSMESPEQRELAQLLSLRLAKSLDDLDEVNDDDEDEDYDDEDYDEDEDEDDDDEDEDEEDLEEDYDEDEDDEDEDDDEDEEDEDEVKPLKM